MSYCVEYVCVFVLDLPGKVVSTEETYKYHMQVQEAPPVEQQESHDSQRSFKDSLKPVRTRSVSNTSQVLAISIQH